MKNKLLFLVLLLSCLWASSALAQNVRFDLPWPSISSQYSTPFLVANTPATGSPVVSVCGHPANQVPCTNYIPTYTQSGVACPNGSQDTPQPQPSACQSTGDAQGNVGFWVAPASADAQGRIDITVCVNNNCGNSPYVLTVSPNCQAMTGVRCITPGNTQGWAGSDVAGWIQSAAANCQASGNFACKIQVAAGNYSTGTQFGIPSNITLECAGSTSTVITWTGSSSGTLIGEGSATTGAAIRHCGLTTAVGGTSIALKLGAVINFTIEDVTFTGFGTEVLPTGDWNSTSGTGGTSVQSNGVYIYNSTFIHPLIAGIAADHTANLVLNNLQMNGTGTTATAILLDSGVNGVLATMVDVFQMAHSLVLRCTGVNSLAGTCSLGSNLVYNSPPWGMKFSQSWFDANSSEGITFDSTLSTNVIDFSCINCWVTSSTSINWHISGGQKFTWEMGQIRGATCDGFLIDSANVADGLIAHSFITNNNLSAGADCHGGHITAAASNIRILDNRIGNITEPFGGGGQKYGVKVAANTPHFAYRGNDANNNVTAGFTTSATAEQSIANNFPEVGFIVANLPTASLNTGLKLTVQDSTAVAAEGQACVGGNSNVAIAISNGTIWKCF